MIARISAPGIGLQAGVVATGAALGVLAGIDPQLAIAAALGLVFAAAALADLTVGLCLFVLLTFLDVLPNLGSLGITKLAGLLLVISWLATKATHRGRERSLLRDHAAFSYLLIVFVAWAGLSIVWAANANATTDTALRYALNFALFPIVYTAVRTRRHVVWVLTAYVAGAAASAAYGVVLGQGAVQADIGRATGTFGDANDFGAALLPGVVLAIGLAATFRRSSAARLAMVGAAGLCAAGMVSSVSRGPMIALGAALIVSIFVAGRWRQRTAILAVIAVLSTVGYFAAIAPDAARHRITSVGNGTGRSDVWTVGWRMVGAHPIRGVGAGNFRTAEASYAIAPGLLERPDLFFIRPKVALNTYLNELAELGIVGISLFILVLALPLGYLVKAWRLFKSGGDPTMELLSRTVFIALAGVLVAYVFISGQLYKQLWLLMALGPPLLALARETSPAVSDGNTH